MNMMGMPLQAWKAFYALLLLMLAFRPEDVRS